MRHFSGVTRRFYIIFLLPGFSRLALYAPRGISKASPKVFEEEARLRALIERTVRKQKRGRDVGDWLRSKEIGP